MRTKLRQLGGQQRYQFTGTFKRTGFKKYLSWSESPHLSTNAFIGRFVV